MSMLSGRAHSSSRPAVREGPPPPRTRLRAAASAAALFLLAPAAAHGSLFALYARPYLDEGRHPAIKVTASVEYRQLVFLKKADSYESTYRLFLKLRNEKGKLVETSVIKKRVAVKDYKETRSSRNHSNIAAKFLVEPGRYLLEATLAVEKTQLRLTKQVAVNVPDYTASGVGIAGPRLFLLGREFASKLPPILDRAGIPDEELVPMEGDVIAEIEKKPAFMLEIFSQESSRNDTARLYVEVVDSKKNELFYGKRTILLDRRSLEVLVLVDVDAWEPGGYVFNAKVVMKGPPGEASTSMKYYVELTRSMLEERFDETLKILSIIASPSELEELEQAEGSARLAAWADFWKKRDPTPDTEFNEALDEHLRRVRYAMENFSTVEPGWKTDRGRVYIRYGPPDEIESTMDPYLQGEYRIWRYYRLNLVFVFFDRFFGVGDFKLISTRSF